MSRELQVRSGSREPRQGAIATIQDRDDAVCVGEP